MGCIEASVYTAESGTILGTHSSLEDCEQQCGVCCIPQCDEFCNYCESFVLANHEYATFEVTGDITVTYNDPMNSCDPWHDPFLGGDPDANYTYTFTINGTYTKSQTDDYWWINTSDPRVSIDGYTGSVLVWMDYYGGWNWYVTKGIFEAPYYYGGFFYLSAQCNEFTWQDLGITEYIQYYYCDGPESVFPPGLTVNGSAVDIKIIPGTENKDVCNNAGGVFWAAWWDGVPGGGEPAIGYARDFCAFYTYDGEGDSAEGCPPPPSSIGGNYDTYSGQGIPTNFIQGVCCEGICSPPIVRSPVDDCFVYNECLDFSAVPNTSGCNDTVTQSGCVQGGLYSPTGIAIGVWHSGQNCTTFDCNA